MIPTFLFFSFSFSGIQRNLTTAYSIFSAALEWEIFLPSIFDPILSGLRTLPKDPIKEFVFSGPSRVNLIYEESTIGVAPLLALIYVKLMGIIDSIKEILKTSNLDSSACSSVTKSMYSFYLSHLYPLYETSGIFINEYGYEDSTLLLLVTAFITVLIILSSRLYLRRRRI